MIEDAVEMEAACLGEWCDQAHGPASGAPGADNADPDQDDDGTDDDSSRPSLLHSLAQDSWLLGAREMFHDVQALWLGWLRKSVQNVVQNGLKCARTLHPSYAR